MAASDLSSDLGPRILNMSKYFQENLVGQELYLQINILYQVFHPLVTCCIFPLVTLTVLNLKIVKGKTRLNFRGFILVFAALTKS